MFKKLLGLFKPKQEEVVSQPLHSTVSNLEGVSIETFEESFRKIIEEYPQEERAEIIAEFKKANIPGLAHLFDEYSVVEVNEPAGNDEFSKIRSAFDNYFSGEGDKPVKMVKQPKFGRIYSIDTWGEWSGRYVFQQDEKGGVYLDFFASHHMTNSRHGRIFEDGHMESLASYWEFGTPYYEDDSERTQREAQRIKDENSQVTKILKAKGFIDYD